MEEFKDMSFHNVLGQSTTVDQSTLFNANIGRHLLSNHSSFSIQINETPPSNIKPEHLSTYERKLLPRNELLTTNKYPDMYIEGEPYDCKISKYISPNKNHVYVLIESPQAFSDFVTHLRRLEDYYKNDKNLILNNFRIHMRTKIEETSYDLSLANTNIQKKEIIHTWTAFTLKTIPNRPDNIGIPIISLQKPYVPEPTIWEDSSTMSILDKALPQGTLDYTKTKAGIKAIMGTYSIHAKTSIKTAMRNAIAHIFEDSNSNID